MRTPEVRGGQGRGGIHGAWAAVALAAVLSVGLAAPAAAGDTGVRFGYYDGADADSPVPAIGLFTRIDVPGPLNLELSADYRVESLLDGDVEATVVPVRLSLLLNALQVVSPYVVAGAGVDYVGLSFRNERGDARDDAGVAFEVHAGAGVEISIGLLTVIADLRYCSVGAVSNETLSTALGGDYDPSGWHASLSAAIPF